MSDNKDHIDPILKFVENEKLRSHSLFEINSEINYAHDDFLTEMFYARQVSSGQTAYKKALRKVVEIFEQGKKLKTGHKVYNTIDAFIDEQIKPNGGFTSLLNEFRR